MLSMSSPSRDDCIANSQQFRLWCEVWFLSQIFQFVVPAARKANNEAEPSAIMLRVFASLRRLTQYRTDEHIQQTPRSPITAEAIACLANPISQSLFCFAVPNVSNKISSAMVTKTIPIAPVTIMITAGRRLCGAVISPVCSVGS